MPRSVEGDFVEGGGQSAAGQIAQAMNCSVGGKHGFDQSGQRGAIALEIALESQTFADRHDRHAVPAEIAANENRIAGLDRGGRNFDAVAAPARCPRC